MAEYVGGNSTLSTPPRSGRSLAAGLRSFIDAMGGPVSGRMVEHSAQQRQRMAAGDYSPTRPTGENIDLADSVAGGLLGTLKAGKLAAGIRAYHGSPHRFDRFDMSKIGTGEGAQAYGHGLYFAESEGVARSYKDALGRPANTGSDGRDMAQWAFSASRGDKASAVQKLKDEVSRYDKQGWPTPAYRNQYDEAIGILERGEDVGGGALYTTRLDVEPEDLLDWDAPLSQQSEKVRAALEDILRFHKVPTKNNAGAETTGGQLVEFLERLGGKDFATGEFRDNGIPGIRYLDQQSRYIPSNLPDNPIANEARQFLDAASGDADAALKAFNDSNPVQRLASDERDEVRKVINAAGRQATRNFVIFDDKLIDITHVDGKPLTKAERKAAIAAMLAGGMSAMGVANTAEAGDATD